MLWGVLLCAVCLFVPCAQPAPSFGNEETDGQSSRKILGSSVVTSVSVVMETGNGKHTYYSDAVGHPLSKPHIASQVASPINLLNPDRYEFYTFNDDGELVKRLMTLEEIQGIIAGGDSDGLYNSEYNVPNLNADKDVSGVVENVQNVLKEEMESHKNPIGKPILDTPDVSANWNMILPAIFGDTMMNDMVSISDPVHEINNKPFMNNEDINKQAIKNKETMKNEASSTEYYYLSSRTPSRPEDEIILDQHIDLTTIAPINELDNETESKTTVDQIMTSTNNLPLTTNSFTPSTDKNVDISSTTIKNLETVLISQEDILYSNKSQDNITQYNNRQENITNENNGPKVDVLNFDVDKIDESPELITNNEESTIAPVITERIELMDAIIAAISSTNSATSSTQRATVDYPKITELVSLITRPTTQAATKAKEETTIRTSVTFPHSSPFTNSTQIAQSSTTKASTNDEQNTSIAPNEGILESNTITTTENIPTTNEIIEDTTTELLEAATELNIASEIDQLINNMSQEMIENENAFIDNQNVASVIDQILNNPMNQTYSFASSLFDPTIQVTTENDGTTFSDSTNEPQAISKENPDDLLRSETTSRTLTTPLILSTLPLQGQLITTSGVPAEVTTEEVSTPITEQTIITNIIVNETENTNNETEMTVQTTIEVSEEPTTREMQFVRITTVPSTSTSRKYFTSTEAYIEPKSTERITTTSFGEVTSALVSKLTSLINEERISTPSFVSTSENLNKIMFTEITEIPTSTTGKNTEATDKNMEASEKNTEAPEIMTEVTEKNIETTKNLFETTENVSSLTTESISTQATTEYITTEATTEKNVTEVSKTTISNQDTTTVVIPTTVNVSSTTMYTTNKPSLTTLKSTSSAIINMSEPYRKTEDTNLNKVNDQWKLVETVPKPSEVRPLTTTKPIRETYRPTKNQSTQQPIHTTTSQPTQEPYHPTSKLDLTSQGTFGVPTLTEDMFMFSKMYNELALKFWTALAVKDINSERSTVVSPFGAISVLAMIFLGARGGTSGEMNDVLKLDDIVTFNPHLVFKEVTESVLARNSISVIARELYSDIFKGKVLGFYKERVRQFYDGHVEEVEFKRINNIIKRRTNALISKQTKGQIPQYLDETMLTLRPPLSALSTNIFQADCSEASTEGRDGELYFIVIPSMRQRRLVPIPAAVWRSGFIAGYDPELDATAVSLGAMDQAISTIFVIPGQQGHSAPGDVLLRLEARLLNTTYIPEAWAQLLKSMLPRPGLEIQLPRFLHKSVINATDALKRMGLRELFNPGKADLRGLHGNAHALYLADMMQVNEFSVCGETQEVHAETYPSMVEHLENHNEQMRNFKYTDFVDESEDSLPLPLRPRQARLPDIPRLRFDRPFLYFVRHNPTGLILHMGRFNPRLVT